MKNSVTWTGIYATKKAITLEEKEPDFEGIMRPLPAVQNDRREHIYPGGWNRHGWLPILCKKRGWRCKGLEITPQLVAYGKQWGAQHGIDPDIELGNIEDSDIGQTAYGVIIASNVFEHVEHCRKGGKGFARLMTLSSPGA